jgi:UDP-N-acetylmuramate--alanine ligase
MILSKVKINNKILCSKEQLTGELKKRHVEVLITLGAGDIDKLVQPIAEMYRKEDI